MSLVLYAYAEVLMLSTVAIYTLYYKVTDDDGILTPF